MPEAPQRDAMQQSGWWESATLRNLGPPVRAPSLPEVTTSSTPLSLPLSTVLYQRSMSLSPKLKASASVSSYRTVTASSRKPVSDCGAQHVRVQYIGAKGQECGVSSLANLMSAAVRCDWWVLHQHCLQPDADGCLALATWRIGRQQMGG